MAKFSAPARFVRFSAMAAENRISATTFEAPLQLSVWFVAAALIKEPYWDRLNPAPGIVNIASHNRRLAGCQQNERERYQIRVIWHDRGRGYSRCAIDYASRVGRRVPTNRRVIATGSRCRQADRDG